MRQLIIACSAIALTACSQPSVSSNQPSAEYCMFSFSGLEDCHTTILRKPVSVELALGDPVQGERDLIALRVTWDEKVQNLQVVSDTTILEGDRGYILFQDITFDGLYDIGITTSFGVANLYLDYWVHNESDKHFTYVGNFPRLTPDPEEKVLTSTVRSDAASYERTVWTWVGDELKKDHEAE
jgi:hypothetical protein